MSGNRFRVGGVHAVRTYGRRPAFRFRYLGLVHDPRRLSACRPRSFAGLGTRPLRPRSRKRYCPKSQGGEPRPVPTARMGISSAIDCTDPTIKVSLSKSTDVAHHGNSGLGQEAASRARMLPQLAKADAALPAHPLVRSREGLPLVSVTSRPLSPCAREAGRRVFQHLDAGASHADPRGGALARCG
jgi:hypothetical protein